MNRSEVSTLKFDKSKVGSTEIKSLKKDRLKANRFGIENMIRIIAGTFVFVSSMIGFFHSRWWLLFTMFVGLNLFQYGFTNFCPLAIILKKIGFRQTLLKS